MGYIEARGILRKELVDVRPVSDNACPESHMNVARHLIHVHNAAHSAALTHTHRGKGVGAIPETLSRVPEDDIVVPALLLVPHADLVAGIAARMQLALCAVAGLAGPRYQRRHKELRVVVLVADDFSSWSPNEFSLRREALLEHILLHIELVVPGDVHRVQMNVAAREGMKGDVHINHELGR